MPLLNLPVIVFFLSLFCQMTNDHLHTIYHCGYQKYLFLLFKQVLNQAPQCSWANKDDLTENLEKVEHFWRDARASHPDGQAQTCLMSWLSPERWTIPCNHRSEMNRCRAQARLLSSLFHTVHWVPLGGYDLVPQILLPKTLHGPFAVIEHIGTFLLCMLWIEKHCRGRRRH